MKRFYHQIYENPPKEGREKQKITLFLASLFEDGQTALLRFPHPLFNNSLSFFPSVNRLGSIQRISFFVNEVKSFI